MKLPVQATTKLYHGGRIREPGDSLTIESIDAYDPDSMIPVGWSLPKKGDAPKLSGKAASAAKQIEKNDAPPPDPENEPPASFRGIQADYGTETVRVTKEQAIDVALERFEGSVADWNMLSADARKSKIMATVKDLVNAGIAAEAAAADEGNIEIKDDPDEGDDEE